MKITKISIKKFRQLENVEVSDIGLINELYGSNGSGKTSFISFITWLLYGETLDYGKNDDMNIDTFKPYELIGGEITLFNGEEEVVLAREFGYDEQEKKTQDFFINGRKVKKQDEYYDKISSCFNLKNLSSLKIKSFNLLRALSDPYYLPNNENQFREFISAILNVDTYNILFDMPKYSKIKKDYDDQDNDFDKCKDYYNQKINEIENNLDKTELLIKTFSGGKFNQEEYDNLQLELQEAKNYKLMENVKLNEKLLELNKLQNELFKSKNNDINNTPVRKEQEELEKYKNEYNSLLIEYNKQLIENNKYNTAKTMVENKISILKKELEDVKKSTFKEIKCPNCDTLINEKDYKEFNKNKVERAKSLKEKIVLAEKELSTYNFKDLTEVENKLQNYLNEISRLKEFLIANPYIYVSEQTKSLESEIKALESEIVELKNDLEKTNTKIIEETSEKINELQSKINALDINRENAKKLELQKQNKATLLENKATYKLRLSLLQEYRNEEIKLIKNKTSEIFGNNFEFEMLVKQKTNDKYKKVCYASIDGLEHNKSNTAKYLKYSIMLLEKIKEYIGGCDLPIIFDIADNIGKSARNDIFNIINNSQIFYTRIADDDNVERELKIIKLNEKEAKL